MAYTSHAEPMERSSIRILSYGDWLFDKDIEYEKEGNMYIVEKLKDVIHSLEPNK